MGSRRKETFLGLCGVVWTWFILIFGVLGLVGCSSFHEVAIISHGEKDSEVALLDQTPKSSSPDSQQFDLSHGDSQQPDSSGKSGSTSEDSAPTEISSKEKTSDILAQSAEDASLPSTLEDVFFEFDQYVIRPKAMELLEQNAKVLRKRYPGREVILEGHCDERGTEEYNLVLGGRRAMAVKNFLKVLGVPADTMRVLSLGKSQPFCLERTLECFEKNRRVHFVFK